MNYLKLNFVYLTKEGQVNQWLNMAQKKFPAIKEKYSFYNKLLSDRKSIFSEVIEINNTGNNKNTLTTSESLSHPEVAEDQMLLIVDVKVNNHDFFQFKLRYKSFVPAPFFRFDSDGDSHRNKVDGIGLAEQIVTTPHFHKFNNEGVEIAYKTNKLLDSKESKALEDINLCIKHFFHESNTRVHEDDFPEIKILSNTLGLKISKDDPHQNIHFL